MKAKEENSPVVMETPPVAAKKRGRPAKIRPVTTDPGLGTTKPTATFHLNAGTTAFKLTSIPGREGATESIFMEVERDALVTKPTPVAEAPTPLSELAKPEVAAVEATPVPKRAYKKRAPKAEPTTPEVALDYKAPEPVKEPYTAPEVLNLTLADNPLAPRAEECHKTMKPVKIVKKATPAIPEATTDALPGVTDLCLQFGVDAVITAVAAYRKTLIVPGPGKRGRPAKTEAKRAHIIALGVWLTKQREALGLTQTMIATALGVTKAAVSTWEMGLRNPPLARLMEALGPKASAPPTE